MLGASLCRKGKERDACFRLQENLSVARRIERNVGQLTYRRNREHGTICENKTVRGQRHQKETRNGFRGFAEANTVNGSPYGFSGRRRRSADKAVGIPCPNHR